MLDPSSCLLPFPDNCYAVRNDSTLTGRRVDFPVAAMPRNASGVPIDPSAWNLNDGFSPGTPILLHVPGIDLARSRLAPITDIGASLQRDSGAVLVDEETGQRWPYFAELDANDPNSAEQSLIIHPARYLREGHTYAVALRDLRTSSGESIPPASAFAKLLQGGTHDPAVEERRPQIEHVLGRLARAHVPHQGLYLAWDFSVASTANLTGRLLHMRNDAFDQLGEAAPAFTVTQVVDFTPVQNPLLQRVVSGTFEVPSYLNQPGGPPGSRLNLDEDGLPKQIEGNVQIAQFVCAMPRAASPEHPAHPSVYGHGLLGSPFEVGAHNVLVMAATYDFVFCATPEIGLAREDIPNAIRVFGDFSGFPSVPDRLQQGVLDELFLGRLLIHSEGFAGSPAFQSPDGRPLIDFRAPLAYDGNSQGGILGGAVMAVTQDIPRGVLGVPAMDYAILINRSVDAIPFLAFMNAAYPNWLTQQIISGLIQMLWDRGEADGYAQNMTNHPLPNPRPHRVLLQVDVGDHQVANVTTEIEARTIAAFIHRPALGQGRSPDVVPYWDIATIPSYPFPSVGAGPRAT